MICRMLASTANSRKSESMELFICTAVCYPQCVSLSRRREMTSVLVCSIWTCTNIPVHSNILKHAMFLMPFECSLIHSNGTSMNQVLLLRYISLFIINVSRDTRCFFGTIHACIWDQYQTYLLVFAKCKYELSLYPCYHLDETSLLCGKQLPGKAITVDVWQDYILVTCPPFDIYVFKVHVQGTLSPLKALQV
jgi:hypothetical protein